VLLMLAGAEGPVRGDPADGDEGAVHHDVGMPGLRGVPDRRAQLGCPRRQQRDGFLHIPPGGRGANGEPGRKLRERLAVAQASKHEQSLLAAVQPPPPRPRSTCGAGG
jgi:hypothetical protein